VTLEATVRVVHPHQDIGDGGLESRDAKHLALEPALTTKDSAHNDRTGRDLLLLVVGDERAPCRE
jgi:hypothetical protein